MQTKHGLPLSEIKKVKVLDNNEPLSQILETARLKLLVGHEFLDPRLRKSVLDKLHSASDNLPDGYNLLVVTAYRPFQMQKKLYRQRLIQMAKHRFLKMIFNYPAWIKEVRRYTAPPGGSSHQCGAAVDVTIVDSKGNMLDIGTNLDSFGEKCNTWHKELSENQKANRQILYDAMINAGFINYPLEWWHYSYGDRMWAAYSGQNECMYGPLNI